MKDYYMIFVLVVVLLTPFLPNLVKAKCPSCGKRKLVSQELEEGQAEAGRFLSAFLCKGCGQEFQREKSGPLEPRHRGS